ncbi:MAG TPA: alpha-hydroxy-acid oxidizing protein [Bryobacteraceae bacterium]|nr:alpha-hydroxy-acid oxidizing protein [Bryobacteraceae bacterium]
MKLTRRTVLSMGISAPAVLPGQELIGEPRGRIAPLAELVNAFEVQAMARRKLPDNVYAIIAGTDRRALERITFRPRLMVNVTQLDLTTELLGEKMFAPILVAPIANQQAFHPEGELATARGASAAKTALVISSQSSRQLSEIVAEAKSSSVWYQLYPDADIKVTIDAAQKAVDVGCKVVCLTVGAPYRTNTGSARLQAIGNLKMAWPLVQDMKRSVKAPLVLKGIMSPDEARSAVESGVQAIVVSNHGGMYTSGFADPIEMLPSVTEAVNGKIPVLIDGSFRRGTDILKALALGARAVLIGRPAMWGLAAYGSDGVKAVLEMLQSELGRNMAMCGKPNVAAVSRELVRVHRR